MLIGYDGHINREAIHAKGGRQRIAQRSGWGRDPEATRAALNAWNASVAAARWRIEKVFGTWKRSYGLARMRFTGLAQGKFAGSFHRHRLQFPACLAYPCSTISMMINGRTLSIPNLANQNLPTERSPPPIQTELDRASGGRQ
jgi:hypothetical protein